MIIIIDNYDSFTYNLYQYIGENNKKVKVYKNDEIDIEKLKGLEISKIVLSPGPGRPEESGITMDVIRSFAGKVPILGVCIGHQAIGQVFGGEIVQANIIMHGKTSLIYHSNRDIFKGIENPFKAMRYHSLVIEKDSLLSNIKVIATDSQGEIMAIKHNEYPIYGVQFHPESIGTNSGRQILKNFLNL